MDDAIIKINNPVVIISLFLIGLIVVVSAVFPWIYDWMWLQLAWCYSWLLTWVGFDSDTYYFSRDLRQAAASANPRGLNPDIVEAVNRRLRFSWVFWITAAMASLFMYMIVRVETHKKPHNLQSYIKAMSRVFPHLEFLMKVNPTKHDASSGRFRYRRGVYDWLKEKKIIVGSPRQAKDSGDAPYTFQPNKLRKQLDEDLGPVYASLDNLTTIRLSAVALAVVFYHEKPDPGTGIKRMFFEHLRLVSKTLSNLDVTEKQLLPLRKQSLKAIAKWDTKGIVSRLTPLHAYELTLIARLFSEARLWGQLPPSWLVAYKPHDRAMWYALHELEILGEYVPHKPEKGLSVEAQAVRTHFYFERATHKRREVTEWGPVVDGLRMWLIRRELVSSDVAAESTSAILQRLEREKNKFGGDDAIRDQMSNQTAL